jgi:hypothetical protein
VENACGAHQTTSLRDLHLRPHVDAFLEWAAVQFFEVRGRRGFLRTALGCAQRQRGPLTRFFDDGRLRLDNNASKRALRRIAFGRKGLAVQRQRRSRPGPPGTS